jgi:glycosyltransferase domain-containing protein
LNKSVSTTLELWFLSRLLPPPSTEGVDDALGSLTVIIPSYCRQPFLLRQIVYWSHSGVKVIILDGSPEPLSNKVTCVLETIPNIRYVNCPLGLVERLAVVGDLIDTPYAVLLGDDEFHLRSGLRHAVSYLKVNSDYVGCIGQSLRFFVENESQQVVYGEGYSHLRYKVSDESVQKRFERAMENYNAATCYAVLRLEVWKDTWASLRKSSCKDVCEVQQALGTYGAGKFSTVEQIYWLRSYENVSIPDHNHFANISFPTWWTSSAYAGERQEIVADIGSVIQKYANLSATEADSAVRNGLEAFNQFYCRSYPRKKLLSRDRIKGAIVTLAKSYMPTRCYDTLKAIFAANDTSNSIQRGTNLGCREALASNQCQDLFKFDAETNKELRDIEYLLFDFYKNYR